MGKLRTPFQEQKDKLDLAIYVEYCQLQALHPDSPKKAIELKLMNKYGIFSQNGIWRRKKHGEQLYNERYGS